MQVRAKEENQRSRDMNAALAAFVEGKSDPADWWHRNARSQDEEMTKETVEFSVAGGRGPRINTPSAKTPSVREAFDYFEPKGQEAATDDSGSEPLLDPHVAKSDRQPSTSSRPALERTGESTDTKDFSPIPTPYTTEITQESDLTSKIRETATRAADLLRKGVGADGVLFLDATVGSFGGLIDSTQGLSQTESETDGSRMTDGSLKQLQHQHNHQEGDAALAKRSLDPVRHSAVLGSAYPPGIEVQVKSAIVQAKISEKILKSLLRRYPNGQIWHFNEEGDASDEDDEVLPIPDGGVSETSEHDSEHSRTPTHKRAGKRARARKRDGRAIQAIFPGIRSLLFLGMWDPHQERWFGASFAVSYSSMRIFSARHELSYVAAFCDVVLAEIWRLEAQELGRSKNDFVSSISHELRSPLGTGSRVTPNCLRPTDMICSTSPIYYPSNGPVSSICLSKAS
jgi:hypothetical protein